MCTFWLAKTSEASVAVGEIMLRTEATVFFTKKENRRRYLSRLPPRSLISDLFCIAIEDSIA
jgi:hypothetical protein